jgi:uncharacterized membrane protein YoaK (UPF0700 family)
MSLHLPRWVWIGAITLACVAGMVNVIGYLGFEHQAVSHLTGTTSLLGAALARGDLRAVGHLWGVLIAFCLGAMLSGLIIQDQTLKLGRRYGVVLALEAALLLAAIPLFKQEQIWGALLAAVACGLQNAMVTTYSGSAVRTTHVSGMFTDLGIGLGHLLRGMPLPVRRLAVTSLRLRRPAGACPADRRYGHRLRGVSPMETRTVTGLLIQRATRPRTDGTIHA